MATGLATEVAPQGSSAVAAAMQLALDVTTFPQGGPLGPGAGEIEAAADTEACSVGHDDPSTFTVPEWFVGDDEDELFHAHAMASRAARQALASVRQVDVRQPTASVRLSKLVLEASDRLPPREALGVEGFAFRRLWQGTLHARALASVVG